MADGHEQRRSGKAGCLVVLLAAVVVVAIALLGAFYFGYIDRWLYEASLERAGAVSSSSASASARDASTAGTPVSVTVDDDVARKGEIPVHYAYAQLDEEDQKCYRIVLTALQSREEQPYPESDLDDLQRIYQCVQADHPELFYVNGVTMETVTNTGSGMVERVSVRGRFAYDSTQTAAIKKQLDEAVAACLAGLPTQADDYAIAKYLYDWLATNVEYDSKTAAAISRAGAIDVEGEGTATDLGEYEHNTSQTAEGPLLWGRAVCGGYAGAYQLLLQAVGIQATFVTGLGNGGSHAWCLVLLDGNYYFVDPTWADPQSEGASGELGYVNYDYLNVASERFARTHVPRSPFYLPECTAVEDNYYVRESLLFDWPDEQRLGELAAASTGGGGQLQVRCTSEDVYRALLDSFVANGRIGAYISGGAYRYTSSSENYSIVVLPA